MGIHRSVDLATLVLSIAFVTLLSSSVAAEDPRIPPYAAAQVFVGRDQDMPLGMGYRLAIQPRVSPGGELIVPSSIIDALLEIRRVLPHWFLTALAAGTGDTECSVTVNNVPYGTLISDWMWANWVKPGSPIRNEFSRLGADMRYSSLAVRNAMTVGLCKLVQTNDDRITMEYVAQSAKFRLVE